MTKPQDKMRAEFEATMRAEPHCWMNRDFHKSKTEGQTYADFCVDVAWKTWQAACAHQSAQASQDTLDTHCYVIDVSVSGLRKTIRIDRMHIDHAINPDHLIGRSIRQAIEDIDAAIAAQGASNV